MLILGNPMGRRLQGFRTVRVYIHPPRAGPCSCGGAMLRLRQPLPQSRVTPSRVSRVHSRVLRVPPRVPRHSCISRWRVTIHKGNTVFHIPLARDHTHRDRVLSYPAGKGSYSKGLHSCISRWCGIIHKGAPFFHTPLAREHTQRDHSLS